MILIVVIETVVSDEDRAYSKTFAALMCPDKSHMRRLQLTLREVHPGILQYFFISFRHPRWDVRSPIFIYSCSAGEDGVVH